jgi:glycosyltransferase involved in cell wall biosynthesis
MPIISVLMSVYNVEPYIDIAVKSILAQSEADFEFLIVDDASTDNTWSKLCALSNNDKRIALWKNAENRGVGLSINSILPFARGKYIARMDGDDISVVQRFRKQISILDAGKADVCGGWIVNFGEYRDSVLKFYESDNDIRTSLLFDWALFQPTLMMKREVMEAIPYRPNTAPATDYDFLVRAAMHFKLYNLQEILLYRRQHKQQVTFRLSDRRASAKQAACCLALNNINIFPTLYEAHIHSKIHDPALPDNWNEVLFTKDWLIKLKKRLVGESASNVLSINWFMYCLKCTHFGLRTYFIYKDNFLLNNQSYIVAQHHIIFLLCVARVRYQSRMYRFLYLAWNAGKNMRNKLRNSKRERADLIEVLSRYI